MKILFIIVFLFIGTTLKAQENRWMYLSNSTDNYIFLVDTLQDDTQQLNQFDGHKDVVIFWINIYKKVKTKKGSYVSTEIFHYAIDTTNKQCKETSFVKYKNGIVISSSNYYDDYYMEWRDVVPNTIGETILKYARSLNNDAIKADLLFNAALNPNPYSKIKHLKKSNTDWLPPPPKKNIPFKKKSSIELDEFGIPNGSDDLPVIKKNIDTGWHPPYLKKMLP